jgi:putative oxidoreductase
MNAIHHWLGVSKTTLSIWAPLPLRLIIGFGFMAHGYAKIVNGPARFMGVLHALGVPAPELMSWLTIAVELIAGAAVFIGAYIPIVSFPMAVVMVVAMFSVHLPFGFSSIKLQAVTANGPQFGPPGYEVDLLYLCGIAALLLIGSGPYSIASMLENRRMRKRLELISKLERYRQSKRTGLRE